MPRIAKTLTAAQVKAIKLEGNHAVGGVPGLYLQLRKSGQVHVDFVRSWVLRYTHGGRRKNLGLGPYPSVSLADAREQGHAAQSMLRQGLDPLSVKRQEKRAAQNNYLISKSFKECAAEYMAAHLEKHRNIKHQKQWKSTLDTYAYPLIGEIAVSDIVTAHVLDVLRQPTTKDGKSGSFWQLKTETAMRLRGRLENILSYAEVAGYREGKNPASWKGHLETQLPSPSKIMNVVHHTAMDYRSCGLFMRELRQKTAISARALEFLILTAVRSGSVREATWSEIDFDLNLWIVPPEHTKANREHRVPLVEQSLRLLQSLPRVLDTQKIFPNSSGFALSDSTLSKLMREMLEKSPGLSGVPHGFRSSFRDWAAEQTSFSEEVRRVATMHRVGDAVQQAYQRSDLLEKRRQLMADWADFLDQ